MAKREGRQTRHRGIKDLGNGVYLVRVRSYLDGQRVERERRIRARSISEALQAKIDLEKEMKDELTVPHLRDLAG